VSRYLAETLGLVDAYVYDFSDPRSRLALIDGPALERLSLYVGIALRSIEIKQEIDGERLRELKSILGEDGYRFASQRAAFLGSIPEFPFEPSKRDPHLRLSLIGARYCVQQLSSLGRTLRRRMTLKLPSSWSSSLVDAPILGMSREPALPPLLRKVIKEKLPQWHPLFA
jgi:hypothetical protein